MYEYKFVEAKAQLIFQNETYQELIVKYAKEGWKFHSAIPFVQSTEGRIKTFKLVFEKEL